MYNFYEYFNISKNAELSVIINSYKNKILTYNKYPKLTERQIYEIKMLKIGLYILTNKNLKKKYNKLIDLRNKTNENCIKINHKEEENNNPINETKQLSLTIPSECNQIHEMSLDSLFNIDNSWMEHIEKNNTKTNKKDRILPNTIGDRVFSMPLNNYNKSFSAEHEIELRNKHQCRDEN
jgi:hypothetical protein